MDQTRRASAAAVVVVVALETSPTTQNPAVLDRKAETVSEVAASLETVSGAVAADPAAATPATETPARLTLGLTEALTHVAAMVA